MSLVENAATAMGPTPMGGNKTDPLLSVLVGLTSCFVFATGMLAVNYYSNENRKVDMRVSKINFSSFVGYVLGLAPILFFAANYAVHFLPPAIFSRIFFGMFTIICLFSWILCAVVLADMANDSTVEKSTKTYISVLLLITLAGSFIFGFATLRGSLFGRVGIYGMPMMYAPPMVGGGYGYVQPQPVMYAPQQPVMYAPQQPVVNAPPMMVPRFGKRRRS